MSLTKGEEGGEGTKNLSTRKTQKRSEKTGEKKKRNMETRSTGKESGFLDAVSKTGRKGEIANKTFNPNLRSMEGKKIKKEEE